MTDPVVVNRVFYDEGAQGIVIDGQPNILQGGNLVASASGDTVTISTTIFSTNVSVLVADYDQIYMRDGTTTFESADACVAYLNAQFSNRPRPTRPLPVPVQIAYDGQTVIPLASPPPSCACVSLMVNGFSYFPPDIQVSDVQVTWCNGEFALGTTDRVVVIL